MPNVTMRPPRAAVTALASAACSAGTSVIAASAAMIQSTASGSASRCRSAAAAIAGALLRPAGSRTMRAPSTRAARSWSATRKRCASLQTTIGAANPGPAARAAVSCSIVRSLVSGQNCFGYPCRDNGHSRVPVPPQRMTGTIDPAGNCPFSAIFSPSSAAPLYTKALAAETMSVHCETPDSRPVTNRDTRAATAGRSICNIRF